MDNKERAAVNLIHGDCLDALRNLPPDAIDGLIIDPPYSSGGTFSTQRKATTANKYCETGSARHSNMPSFSGDNMDMRSFTNFLREVLLAARNKTVDGGTCCVFIDFRNLPAVADAMQMAGWTWRGVAVWDKGNSRPQKGRFRNRCEYIVWGSNGAMPYERSVPYLDGLFAYSNVAALKAQHQTEKPVALMERIVEIVPEGGTVCDCFMGSGSTGVAALNMGRKFIGVESLDHYFDVAKRRILSANETKEDNENDN